LPPGLPLLEDVNGSLDASDKSAHGRNVVEDRHAAPEYIPISLNFRVNEFNDTVLEYFDTALPGSRRWVCRRYFPTVRVQKAVHPTAPEP